MTMKKIFNTAIISSAALVLAGCAFLDVEPQGILQGKDVNGAKQVDGFVIAAYSALGNDHYDTPFSLWPYGNVRSDDAYKGGNDENDISTFHFFEISGNIRTDFGEPDALWYNCYQGISRANRALAVLNAVTEDEVPLRETRMGEMYFIRGHFYFLLKILFKKVPYIDEKLDVDKYDEVPNSLPDDELWGLIAADFKNAFDRLPDEQPEVGRADKVAAAAYLAKTYLYKAYRQKDNNDVIYPADAEDLAEVVRYADYVIGSRYGLEYDFAYNFLPGDFENGTESIFAIQFSKDDGTMFGRLNWSDVLSLPMGLGCCDFHKPSQNLINAFRTQDGLPRFNDFNDANYTSSMDADPRLFHTVAIPGLPYKYNENRIYQEKWNRNTSTYGVHASLKENVDPDCDCFVNVNPFYGNSKNRILIRYADVLLMKAEALVELQDGRYDEARLLVNQLRERAARSTMMIPYAKNLNVNTYDEPWTDYTAAQQRVRWERRLELAMEGSRFFDLVRWGTVAETMNAYYAKEAERRYYYQGASFTRNRNEFVPIPQKQINYTNGLYEPNYGW